MAEAVGAYMFELAAAEVITWNTAAAISTFVTAYGAYAVLGATLAFNASEQRRMQAQAKDAAANAARDRTVTVNGAIVPRDLVLGRARTGGSNFYYATTGTDSSTLYIAQTLAGHQIDAVEQIYVNDEPVTLNAQGFVTTAPYSLPANATGSAQANSAGLLTLPSGYVVGTVYASIVTGTTSDRQGDRAVTKSVEVTVTGNGSTATPYVATTTPGATVSYNYTNYTTGSLRFTVHLGGAGQVVDPSLHAAFPSEWLSTFVVQGVAYMVARLNYDTNAFPSSVPSISARVRGALLDDPRGTTPAVPGDEYFDDVTLLLQPTQSSWASGLIDKSFYAHSIASNVGVTYIAQGGPFNNPYLHFAGPSSGSLIEYANSPEFDANVNDIAFECWIRPTEIPAGENGAGFILARQNPGSYLSYISITYRNNKKVEAFFSNGNYYYPCISSSVIELNVWTYIAFKKTGNTQALYINGVSESSTYITNGSELPENNSSFYVGFNPHYGNDFSFMGDICDVRITKNVNRIITLPTQPFPSNLYIPATNAHAWSENPALMMRHVYSHPRLGGATITADEDARFIAAANACDTPTVYTVGGVAQPSRPLFTAGGVWRFDGGAPSNILNDLAQAMGGAWAFAGGEFYLRAGIYSAPVMTLTDADLAVIQRSASTESQSPIEVSVHRPTADMLNTVKPIIYDSANDYKKGDLREVTSAELVTRDGAVLSTSVEMSAVQYAPQAQHIAGIILRDGRDPLTIKAPFKMRAFPLELLVDNVRLILTELAIDGVFNVLGRKYAQGTVELTLKETSAQITTLGANFVAQGYATNSHLPKPWEVATIGLLAISSGTDWLQVSGDGTIQSYMYVTWPTVTDIAVLQGGSIELQYRLGTAAEWTTLTIPGDSADALIGPVTDGNLYLLRARLCTSIYKGDWGKLAAHTVVGKTEPPPAFDTFLIKAQPDGTRQYNFSYGATATPPDWMGAEIRYITGTVSSPNWASMTPLQDGTSYYTNSPVEINAPQAGTYTFACKSLDTTGNESTAIVRTLTLPDRRLANVFDWYDEAAEGWPGTRTGCTVVGTALEATDTTTWATLPATWAQWTRWNTNPASPITYTAPERDLGIVITATFDATLVVSGSYTQQLRTSLDGSTWSQWGGTDAAFTARYVQWRITVAATTAEPVPVIAAALYRICAPMRQEYLNDLDISTFVAPYRLGVGDVRVPITGAYTIIKRTTVVLQDTRAGQWAYVRLDQDTAVGPRWQIRLDGVLTDPQLIDFFIEAY